MDDEPADYEPDAYDRIKIAIEVMPLHQLALRVADYAAAKDWQFAALAAMALSKRSMVMTAYFVEQAEKEQTLDGDDS